MTQGIRQNTYLWCCRFCFYNHSLHGSQKAWPREFKRYPPCGRKEHHATNKIIWNRNHHGFNQSPAYRRNYRWRHIFCILVLTAFWRYRRITPASVERSQPATISDMVDWQITTLKNCVRWLPVAAPTELNVMCE